MSSLPPGDEAEAAVQDYLRRRGFHGALREFLRERALGPPAPAAELATAPHPAAASGCASSATLLSIDGPELEPDLPLQYRQLRDFVDGALDTYQGPLRQLLFPLFMHTFGGLLLRQPGEAWQFFDRHKAEHAPDHGAVLAELDRLDRAATPHSAVMACWPRSPSLPVPRAALQLLLGFAQDRGLWHTLRLLNDVAAVPVRLAGSAETDWEGSSSTAINDVPLTWEVAQSSTGHPTVTSPLPSPGPSAPDAQPSICLYTYFHAADRVTSVAFSKKRHPEAEGFLVAGFTDSRLRRHACRAAGGAGVDFIGHAGPVYAVDVDAADQFILSASEDRTCRLWRAAGGPALAEYRGHSGPVWAAQLAPRAHLFATGGHDRTARIWATDRLRPVRLLVGHFGDVEAVRWHPNGSLLATAAADRTVRLWDVAAAQHARLFAKHPAPISALALSPNGRLCAVGLAGGAVRVWDIAEGRVLCTLGDSATAAGDCRALAFSPDSRTLAAGGSDAAHAITLWGVQRAAGQERLQSFATKATRIVGLEYFAAGLLLAAGAFAPDLPQPRPPPGPPIPAPV